MIYLEKEIKNNMRILLSKFIDIRNLGYVQSQRNGSTGVGMTFESLLGKKEDSESLPDYYGIEIKVRRYYSKYKLSLFNCAPRGETTNECLRLRDLYGYPRKGDKKLKRMYCSCNCIEMQKIGCKYFSLLSVDHTRNRLILNIYDKNKKLIDNKSYWDLDVLMDRINIKMKYLAVIRAYKKINNNVEYFKYRTIDFYKLKSGSKFIELIESGLILVTFKVDSLTSSERYGQMDSHGVDFSIDYEHLNELYDSFEIR